MLGIIGGRVYDPQNDKAGEIGDIWVKDGRIVPAAEVDREKAEIIDAAGLVVMAGGVDIHAHIVGGEVNAGRKLRPEDHRGKERAHSGSLRAGAGGTVPSTYATGQLYSELGYTTVMQASTAPLMARHTHEELEDTPNVDNGAFMVMGNNHIVMQSIADKQFDRARDYVAWLLQASRGYAIKLVNPGGVENWKWGRNVAELDDEVIGYGVTPRQIMETLATIADDLGLPHAAHIHGINLGRHTSARTSIETIKALDGHRAHLCHLQFLSYGSGKGHVHKSEAVAVAEAVNASPKLTVDVGQVVFGRATTMTCDGPLQHTLHNTAGGRWMNDDVEGESGGGIVPIEYKPGNPINATMWLTGLELFLLIDDPWKVFLTTDHPNAGTFSNYPQIIRLLMDRGYREEMIATLHPRARKGAAARRAGPRVLAQRHRRHHPLRARARAGPQGQGAPRRRRRRRHRRVRGAGRQGGHVRPAAVRVQGRASSWPATAPSSSRWRVAPTRWLRTTTRSIEDDLRAHFKAAYTVSYDNYAMLSGDGARIETVACG